MDEAENPAGPRFRRSLRIFGFGSGVLIPVCFTIGFVAAHLDHDHDFTTRGIAILAGVITLGLVCAWLLARELKKPTGEEPLTPKERLNRNILIACGGLGGLMGASMMLVQGGLPEGGGLFSNEPMPTWMAAVMVAIIGGLLPVVSYFWHRTVDEQEADAYKTGALWGLYVYMLGAPVWWFAWRGGFAPEPNGTAIYFATVLTVGAVWIWKKYR